MKVNGTSGVGSTGGARQPRAAGGGDGFRVPGPAAAAPAGGVGRAGQGGGVLGVEALLALQDVGGPLERRRRQVSRAGRLLDVLDDVKAGLLDGAVNGADLERLQRAIKEQRENTEDPGLEDLLEQIETRAMVELAKLEQVRRAA